MFLLHKNSADCRPFKMDVTHYAKDNASLDGKLFLRFERDFFCTVCCINRYNNSSINFFNNFTSY